MAEDILIERINGRLPALVFGLSWDFSLPHADEAAAAKPVGKGPLHRVINFFRRHPEETQDHFEQQVKAQNLQGEDLELASAFWARRERLANLDARALLLSKGQIVARMTPALPELMDGAITSTGDDTTGSGDGDDERLTFHLGALPADVDQVVLYVDTIPALALCEYANPACHLSYVRDEKRIMAEALSGVSGTAYVLAVLARRGEDFVVVPVRHAFAKDNQAGLEKEIMGHI